MKGFCAAPTPPLQPVRLPTGREEEKGKWGVRGIWSASVGVASALMQRLLVRLPAKRGEVWEVASHESWQWGGLEEEEKVVSITPGFSEDPVDRKELMLRML